MCKKNLKLFSLLFLSYAFTSCSNDNLLSFEQNKNFLPTKFNKKISDSVFTNSAFYNDSLIDKTVFYDCSFSNQFGIKRIQNSKFDSSRFSNNAEINFLVSNLSNVTFENCEFNSVWFRNSKNINNLNIINCKIEELVIDQAIFNSVLIEAYKDTIKKIRIQGCQNSKHIKFAGYINEIVVEGGDIQFLDVSNVLNQNAKLTIFSTILKNPNFVNKSAKNYSILYNSSIENATLSPNENSILKEEIEWKDKNSKYATETQRTEIKKGYLVSKSVYSYLSKIFENDKKYELADYFYHRSKICEREINSEGMSKYINDIFYEKIKGNDGTNYLIIIFTFFIITAIFSVIYFFLGRFKFTFGYYIKTRLLGESLETQNPTLLAYHKNKFALLGFILNCMLFSLSNMVLGALNNGIHFYNFTTMYLYPPRKYGAIGIGRYISILQGLIGLILVFFFISAFLRLNR